MHARVSHSEEDNTRGACLCAYAHVCALRAPTSAPVRRPRSVLLQQREPAPAPAGGARAHSAGQGERGALEHAATESVLAQRDQSAAGKTRRQLQAFDRRLNLQEVARRHEEEGISERQAAATKMQAAERGRAARQQGRQP